MKAVPPEPKQVAWLKKREVSRATCELEQHFGHVKKKSQAG